jgi:hypothetical protein
MGIRCRCRPRRHSQLGENVAQVTLDCFLTQHQGLRNVGIAPTLGYQFQHFYFSLSQTAGPRPMQQPIDLFCCRRCAHFGKAAAGNRKLRSGRILIT